MVNIGNVASHKKVKSGRRPIKHKPKDKPKRPLSAYNYFLSDERKKIIKAVECDDDASRNEIDPELSKEQIEKLKGGDCKVKFEVLGKLIGSRWKNINDEKTAYYNSIAELDKKRYANEIETYKQRKESMRQGAPTSFTENNHIYPHDQCMASRHMQSRPSAMHGGHMGYMTGFSNGNVHGQMPIMASPNHIHMPPPPAYYDHVGNNAHNHNARYANGTRFDSRDVCHYRMSSSQYGSHASFPPHASGYWQRLMDIRIKLRTHTQMRIMGSIHQMQGVALNKKIFVK